MTTWASRSVPNSSGPPRWSDEAFDDGHDVIGGAAPSDVHGQGLAGVLVEDAAQLQAPAIGALVELEVDGPHVVRSLRPQQRPPARRPGPACASRATGGAQPLVPPQAPRPLAVDG